MQKKATHKLVIFLALLLVCSLRGNAQLTFSVTSSSGTFSITCSSSVILLSASSNFSAPLSYTWISPSLNTSTTNSLTVLTPGVYTLAASSGTALGSQTLSIGSNTTVPLVSVSASANSLTCSTYTVLLTALVNATNVSYSWIEPGVGLGCSSYSCVQAVAGTYTVNVKNLTNSCTNTATIQVNDGRVYPIWAASNLFTVACPNGIVDLNVSIQNSTVGLLYQWLSPSGATTNGSNTPVLTTNAPGYYTLTATNSSNGCSSRTLVLVYACVGMEELALSEIKLFPNPVTTDLYLQFNANTGPVKIKVYDIWGREIKVDYLRSEARIDFLDTPRGLYYLQLETPVASRVVRILKD